MSRDHFWNQHNGGETGNHNWLEIIGYENDTELIGADWYVKSLKSHIVESNQNKIEDMGGRMSMALKDLVKGLVIGGVVGMAIGVLYAPKSGCETRDDLTKSTKKLYGQGKERYEQALRDAEVLVDRGKAEYSGSKERLNKAIQAGVEAFKEPVQA
jgi:gas vesicle protein